MDENDTIMNICIGNIESFSGQDIVNISLTTKRLPDGENAEYMLGDYDRAIPWDTNVNLNAKAVKWIIDFCTRVLKSVEENNAES